jgi:trehalose 6-phosphate phosphatase
VTAICKNERCDSLEILPGKLVIEIKPGGYDKGTGLREMMSVPPFTGRKPIFIGDDITDNAAFAALPDFDGTGFSVGGSVPGAAYNFDGPQDVRRWLKSLVGRERTAASREPA